MGLILCFFPFFHLLTPQIHTHTNPVTSYRFTFVNVPYTGPLLSILPLQYLMNFFFLICRISTDYQSFSLETTFANAFNSPSSSISTTLSERYYKTSNYSHYSHDKNLSEALHHFQGKVQNLQALCLDLAPAYLSSLITCESPFLIPCFAYIKLI